GGRAGGRAREGGGEGGGLGVDGADEGGERGGAEGRQDYERRVLRRQRLAERHPEEHEPAPAARRDQAVEAETRDEEERRHGDVVHDEHAVSQEVGPRRDEGEGDETAG